MCKATRVVSCYEEKRVTSHQHCSPLKRSHEGSHELNENRREPVGTYRGISQQLRELGGGGHQRQVLADLSQEDSCSAKGLSARGPRSTIDMLAPAPLITQYRQL